MRKSTLAPRAITTYLESQSHCHIRRQADLGLPLSTAHVGQLRCLRYAQKRNFLGITNWKRKGSDGTNVDRETGIKQMNELVVALKNQLRPPPPYILARAFKSFVESRLAHPDFLTLEQLRFLYATIEHLVIKFWDGNGVVKAALQPSTLENALVFLAASRWENDAYETMIKLSTFIYEALCRRIAEEGGVGESGTPDVPAIQSYISILSASRSTDNALKILEEHWDTCLEEYGVQPWADVLGGYIAESNPEMLNITLKKMEARGLATTATVREPLRSFFGREGRPGLTRAVFDRALAKEGEPSIAITKAAINLAIREQAISWARELLASLPQQGCTPQCLDMVLLVDAAAGYDAKHVCNKLQDLLVSKPKLRESITIQTINGLMEFALSSSRYSDVEIYAGLSEQYDLGKDANTYMLLMCSRLQSGDIQGTVIIYEKLDNETTNEDIDPTLLNRLIRNLCFAHSQNFDYDIILCLVDRLLDSSKGTIEAPTVAALCTSMLEQHDTAGVADLLEHVGGSFGLKDQEVVKQPLVSYIRDLSEPSEGAWEMYELLVKMFPSTGVELRTEIMKVFFDRGRSDYACLVFGHMRAEDLGGRRPTKQTYIACLQGIADSSDEENLKMVHNMLKMDMQIKLDTQLMNALMLAYASCGQSDSAMEYFREILHSEEGPSEQSLLIFFRTCETHYEGRKEAQDMIKRLNDLGIQVDRKIYTGFIAALGCQGDLQGALSALRSMYPRTGEKPDAVTYV